MKKKLLIVALLSLCGIINTKKPKHSNIYIQKIINKSGRAAFMSLERILAHPLEETVDIGAPIMHEDFFEKKHDEESLYAFSVPVWQNTFLGNQFNVISLGANPGRIYFLYVINGHLWAVKTPEKKGELKGIHLLDPSDKERTFILTIQPNHVLELEEIKQEKSAEPTTKKTSKDTQSKSKTGTTPLSRPSAASSVQNNHRPRRFNLPSSARAKLQSASPD